MQYSSKVKTQTNWSSKLIVWAWGFKFYTVKFVTVETLLTIEARRKHLRRRPSKNKDLRRIEDKDLYKLEAKFAGSGPMESNGRIGQDTS
jgi:hypothetical protein